MRAVRCTERTLHVPVERDIAIRGQLEDEDTDDYLFIDGEESSIWSR